MTEFLPLVIALPLVGALILHFLGRRIGDPWSGWLAVLMVVGAGVIAAVASGPLFTGEIHDSETIRLWDWMPAVGATLELRWDALASLMALTVTGVGALIHVFAIGYMRGDDRFSRFFAYMNLFVASMLTLVLAGNFAMLFMGWELVGLCSYLLISFWHHRPSAAAAGKKAFVVNRIGDVGFVVALMLIFARFGTFSFDVVFSRAAGVLDTPTATAIGLLLLVGAAGKSAQIPLHVWLPDAMEGPTPVSALIHAATMVTAGVYLVARSAAIFDLAPGAGTAVATVGALTALAAATVALGQTDIKRVLAYSTISQLGYMFLAVGLGGYVAGVFHLMTHAFFKALLFLGAGSVIHAMHHEQDMRRMGGLRSKMPITSITMAVGTLAIAGFPGLAGFWSKDEILGVAYGRGGYGYVLFGMGLVTALFTAFYMTRQWVMVFMGEPRWGKGVEPHESPRVMTIPLVVLALLSLVGGAVNTPWRLGLDNFLHPVFEGVRLAHPPEGLSMFFILAGVSVAAGLAGIIFGYRIYRRPKKAWEGFEGRFGRLWGQWERAYRVDDAYGAVLVAPGKGLAGFSATVIDAGVIDGGVNGAARLAKAAGARIRRLQTGYVRNYSATFAIGLILILAWLVGRAL